MLRQPFRFSLFERYYYSRDTFFIPREEPAMLDQSVPKVSRARPELLSIHNLEVNTTVFGWLFAAKVQTRTASNRKTYLQLILRDQQGNEITARYFEPPRLDTFILQEGKAILLEGSVEEYNNQVQIKLMRE